MAGSVYTDLWTRSSRTSSSHRLERVAACGTAIPSLITPARKEKGRSRDRWFLVRFIDTQHGADGLRPLCVPFAPSLRASFCDFRRKYPARGRRREPAMNPSGEVGLDFRLLGPFEVASNGRPIEIGSPKQRALLAMLLVHRGRVVSSDALAEELWAGHPPASVVTTLSSLVSRLRRLLVAAGSEESGVFLRSSGTGYRLEIDARRVDAHRFDELVAQARQALAGYAPEVASRLLGQALALWRGPALADLADRSFARAEATRLDEARLEVIEELSEVELTSGRAAAALALLEPQVAAHPLRERAWGLLMLSLYRLGRQAEALRAYQELRRLLGEELGLEPTTSLRRLEQQILLQSPELEGSPRSVVPFGHRGGLMPGSATVTILFTDLVGSTELAARLGDDAADEARRGYFAALRSALAATAGEEVKTLGDGIMAAFSSTVDAIEEAVRIVQAVERLNRRSERPYLTVR